MKINQWEMFRKCCLMQQHASGSYECRSYAEMEPAHISAEIKENHGAKEMFGEL